VQLLDEHERGREIVRRLEAVADRYACDDKTVGPDLAEVISDYSALLRAHIALEEEGPFEIADHELPEMAHEELEKGYERVERETIGEGRHEQFHALLDRLEAKYAVKVSY